MIFTFLMWICTLRSTIAFSSLLFFVWLTFLMLGIGYLDNDGGVATAAPNPKLNLAGGAFGIIAAFIAWWNMMAGILDTSNVTVPFWDSLDKIRANDRAIYRASSKSRYSTFRGRRLAERRRVSSLTPRRALKVVMTGFPIFC